MKQKKPEKRIQNPSRSKDRRRQRRRGRDLDPVHHERSSSNKNDKRQVTERGRDQSQSRDENYPCSHSVQRSIET